MTRLLRVTTLLACLAATLAIDLRGKVLPNDLLREVSKLSSDTEVLLDGGLAGRSIVTADGSFVLHRVSAGQHVLAIASRELHFPDLLVDVPADSAAKPTVRPHRHTHITPTNSPLLPYPIQLHAGARQEYQAPKQGFNLKALIMGNPMIAMMVVGVGMMLLLPKLVNMIDPDAMEEVRAQQAKNAAQMQSVQNMDFADFSLSKLLSGGSAPAASTSVRASGSGSSGGETKKRR